MIPEFESDRRKYRALAGLVALAGGIAVSLVSVEAFPHHSINHDEGVYLQQAAMLLDGRLFLHPPVPEAFRPWFFVRDGSRLYPKYSPVPAAMFAVGKLLGSYRLALGGIAAAIAALTFAVTAEAFDRRTGLLAATFLVASPLYLVNSAVFLPYAPTTMLNLLFAFAYLRADRLAGRSDPGDRSTGPGSPALRWAALGSPALRWATLGSPALRWATLAGAAVGLAFFARPYTAVLFAAPFLVHALWTLRSLDRRTLLRQGTTAALGIAGVGITLAYNWIVTGSPLVFPYEAFAPLDGLGFGRRAILGYERDYTPALALRANAEVLWRLFARWVVAGPLGTALAAVGLLAWIRRQWTTTEGTEAGDRDTRIPARIRPLGGRQAVLAGLFVSIPAGNVYFWGNLNVLGDLAVADDGLIVTLGPYYHFDLLVPVAAFAASGAIALAGWWRTAVGGIRDRVAAVDARRARALTLAGVLVAATLMAGANAAAVDRPMDRNRGATAQLDRAYEPFEDREFEDALVFLPTPYGDWLNHPFQRLRNRPGYDGPAVYALPERQFAVVDAFPDRRTYRYTYRGDWRPTEGRSVTPRLQRVRHVRGGTVRVGVTLGIPPGAERASVTLSTGNGSARYAVEGSPDRLDLALTLSDGELRIDGPLAPATAGGDGNRSLAVADRDRVTLTVDVDDGGTGGFTYRVVAPVAREDGDVRALTPYAEVCRIAFRCGGEAAYVPGEADEGVLVETSLSAGNATDAGSFGGRTDDPGSSPGRLAAGSRSR